MAPGRSHAKNVYVSDRLLPRLPALYLLLISAEPPAARRRRIRGGVDAPARIGREEAIAYMRERGITFTYDPALATLLAEAAKTVTAKAS